MRVQMRELSAARVPHMLSCAKYPRGAHRCFSAGPTGVYRGGRAPAMKVGGHRELGTGEHMWDPCRGELSHLSQHFWQMVLEGDGSTLGSEGVSAVRARTACSQSRTAETSSGGRVKRSQLRVG